MDEAPTPGRRATTLHRKHRLVAGGSSMPAAVILCYLANKYLGVPTDDHMLTAAIDTLIGSVVTAATMCFWDIRSMILSRFGRKRAADRARRGE